MIIHEGADLFPSLTVFSADAGKIVYPPGGTHGPRLQTTYQLVLLDAGSAVIEIDGVANRLEPGQVAFLKRGRQELFRFAEREETRHRWIHVHGEARTPEAAEELDRLPFAQPLKDSIGRLTDQMLAVQQRMGRAKGAGLLAALGLAALLQYAAESLIREEQRVLHPAVTVTLQDMQARLDQPLRVADLARAAGVTPEHLIRLFQRDLGTTPAKRLWALRAERGGELLRETGLTIGEIAERCGFQTTYHFARVIKATTGLTPSEIRGRSLRNGE